MQRARWQISFFLFIFVMVFVAAGVAQAETFRCTLEDRGGLPRAHPLPVHDDNARRLIEHPLFRRRHSELHDRESVDESLHDEPGLRAAVHRRLHQGRRQWERLQLPTRRLPQAQLFGIE